MTSTLANMTRKAADKIEQLGERNKQNKQSNINDPAYNTSTGSNTYGSNTNNPAYDNPQSTNAGPHNSNMMNKIDPRVDADRDGRNDPSSRVGGYGNTQQQGYDGYNTASGAGYGSTTHTTHQTHHTGAAPVHNTGYGNSGPNTASYDNPQSTNAGPHNSNMLNKLDPRVDSDRDHRNDPTSHTGGYGQTQTGYGSNTGVGYDSGAPQHHQQHHHHQQQQHHGGAEGYSVTNQSYDNPQSTNTGPHKSNLMNKLDPRVDSDRDGRNDPASRTGGYGNTQTGGGYGGSNY